MNTKDRTFKLLNDGGDLMGHRHDAKSKKAKKVVDPELADIVLETRSEIEDWQARYKKLKYNLALTNKRVTLELTECENRFARQYKELEK